MPSTAEAQQQTQTALAAALAAGQLPAKAQQTASDLMARLETATRVTVLGGSKTGKSGVVNLLAGSQILPEGLSFPTTQIVYGETERVTMTLRDGSSLTLDGPPEIDRISTMAPAFVKIEMPLAALRKISLMEVALPHDAGQQARALKWALKQTDIAIWCTSQFDVAEQALWSTAPDAIKDHAILLRTRADELGQSSPDAIRALELTMGEEFAYALPVSTQMARGAHGQDGSIDKAELRASGAMKLISTILRQIETGRQYAVDQADILLHQFEAQMVAAKRAADAEKTQTPLGKPKSGAPVAQSEAPVVEAPDETPEETLAADVVAVPEDETASDGVAAEETAPASEDLTDVRDEPTLDASVDAAPNPDDMPGADATTEAETADDSASEPAVLDAASRAAVEAAVNHLQETGADLAALDAEDSKEMLKRTAKSLSWLGQHWDGDAHSASPAISRFQSMTQDADDLVQLLKIEGGEDSALDAVSMMLQIKRGLQAELALAA